MQLRMQSANGQAQDLPPNDDIMNTGPMGDCVSIIVLWNFVKGRADNVRGYHGLGGLGAINMPSLFTRVPDDQMTVVHCIIGHIAQAGSDREKAPREISKYVPNATVHYHDLSNANVTRDGSVSPAK